MPVSWHPRQLASCKKLPSALSDLQGRLDHRWLSRRRHAHLPRPQLSAWGRRHRLWPGVRRFEDGAARSGAQHPTRVGRCRRLRRGRRRACGRPRCPRDRAHQPEWRHSGALGPAGRADGERRPERASDHDEIVRRGLSPSGAIQPAWFECPLSARSGH